MQVPLGFIFLAILAAVDLSVSESPPEEAAIAPVEATPAPVEGTPPPVEGTRAPGEGTPAPGDSVDGLVDGNEHSRNMGIKQQRELTPKKGIVGKFIDLFSGFTQVAKPVPVKPHPGNSHPGNSQGGKGTGGKVVAGTGIKLVNNLSFPDGTRIIVYLRRFRFNRDGSLTSVDFNDKGGITIVKTYRRVVLGNGEDKIFEIPTTNGKLRVLSTREFPDGTYVIVMRKKTARRADGNERDIEYDDGPFSPSILLRTTIRVIFPSGHNIFYQLEATRRVNIVSYSMEPDGTLVIVFQKKFRQAAGGSELEVDVNFNAPNVITKNYAVRIYRNRRIEITEQVSTIQKQTVSQNTIGARDSPYQKIILSYTEYDGTKVYIIRLRIRVKKDGTETEVEYRDSSPSSKIITVIRRVTIDRKISVIQIHGAELPQGNSGQNGKRRLIVTYPDPDGSTVYVYRVRVTLRPDGDEEEVDYSDKNPGLKRTVVITIIKRVRPDGKVTVERMYPANSVAKVPSQTVQIIYRVTYTLQLLIDNDPKHRILVSQQSPDGTLIIIYRVRVRKEPDGTEAEVDPTDNKPGTFVVIVKKVIKPSGEVTETKTYPSNPSSLTSKPVPSAPSPQQQPQANARPLGSKEQVIETKVEPDGSVVTIYQIVGTKNPDGSLAELDDENNIPNHLKVTFVIKRIVKPDGSIVDAKLEEVTPRPLKNAPKTTPAPTPSPELIEKNPNHRMQTTQVRPDGTKIIVYRVRILKLADGSEAELDYDDELPDSVVMKVQKIVRPSGKVSTTKTELRKPSPKTTPRPSRTTTTTTPSPQVNEIVEILPPPKSSNPQPNPRPEGNRSEDPKHKVTDTETEPDGTRRITYIVRVVLLPDGTEKELDFNDPTPDSFVIKVIKTIRPDGSVSETKFTENTVDVTEAPADKPVVVTTAKPSQLTGVDPVLLPDPGTKQKVIDVQRYPDGRIVVIIQVKIIVSPDGTVTEADDNDTSPNVSIKQIEKTKQPDGSISVSENILPVSAANGPSNNGPDSFDETTFTVSSDTMDPDGTRKIVYQKTVQVQPDGSETIVPETELTPGTIRIIVEKLIRPDGRVRVKTIRRVITESTVKLPEESAAQNLESKPDIDFSTFKIIGQETSADGTETTIFRKVVQKLPDGSERTVEGGNDRQPGMTIIRVERITRPNGSVEIKVSKKTISGKPVSSGSSIPLDKPHEPGSSEPEGFKLVKQTTRNDGSKVLIYRKVIRKQPDGTEVPVDENDRSPGVIIVFMQRLNKPGGQIEISQVRVPAEAPLPTGNDYALLFTQKVSSSSMGSNRKPFNPSEYNVVNSTTEADGSFITIYRKVIRVRPDGTEMPTDENDSSPDAVIVTVQRTQRPDGTVIIRETRQSVPAVPELRLPDGRLFNPDEYTFVSESKEDDGTVLTTFRQVVQVQPDGSEAVLPDSEEDSASGVIYIITIEKRQRPSGTVSIRMRKRRKQTQQVGGQITINVQKIQVQSDGTHLAFFEGDGGPSSLTNGNDDAPSSGSQFDATGFKVVDESVASDGTLVQVYRKKIKLRQDGTELILADDDQSPGATVIVVEKRTLKDGTIIIKETRSSAQNRQPSNKFSWVPLKLYPGYNIVESSTDADGSQMVVIESSPDAKNGGKVVRKKLRKGPDGKVREESLDNGDAENYSILETLKEKGKLTMVDYENDRSYKLASSKTESDGTEVKVFKKRVQLSPEGKETDVDYADGSSVHHVYVKTVEMRRRPSGSVSVSESFVPNGFKELLR